LSRYAAQCESPGIASVVGEIRLRVVAFALLT
jgi:hypothetical protein